MTDDELEAIRARCSSPRGFECGWIHDEANDDPLLLLAEVDRLRAREAELRAHVLDRSYLAGISSEDTLDDAESQWWAGYRRAMRDTARRLGADLAPDARTATDEGEVE